MVVTELGMLMEVRPLQLKNAEFPMVVTELGIIALLHPAISVLVFVSMMALQLFRESYFVFPLSTLIIKECRVPDGIHGIGDVDGCQAAAIRESIVPDGSHGIGDVDGGQTTAVHEYFKY